MELKHLINQYCVYYLFVFHITSHVTPCFCCFILVALSFLFLYSFPHITIDQQNAVVEVERLHIIYCTSVYKQKKTVSEAGLFFPYCVICLYNLTGMSFTAFHVIGIHKQCIRGRYAVQWLKNNVNNSYKNWKKKSNHKNLVLGVMAATYEMANTPSVVSVRTLTKLRQFYHWCFTLFWVGGHLHHTPPKGNLLLMTS